MVLYSIEERHLCLELHPRYTMTTSPNYLVTCEVTGLTYAGGAYTHREGFPVARAWILPDRLVQDNYCMPLVPASRFCRI